MPININEFKILYETLTNKNQKGNTLTPTKLNEYAKASQLQVYEKDYQDFMNTGISTDFLKTFLVPDKILIVPPTGILLSPDDLQHTLNIKGYYVPDGETGIPIPLEMVTNDEWNNAAASQLQRPTKEFPYGNQIQGGYRFLPKDIGRVFIDYYRAPKDPTWGYTEDPPGVLKYDPSTSIDFEPPLIFINEIMSVFLSYVGISLRAQDIQAWAQMNKQETNSTQ